MISRLLSFFEKYGDGRPVLLALSGGPDSMALYHLFLKAKISFHVAHLDHGWREESGEEARQLCSMVERAGIPFHLHRILEINLHGNLEEQGRDERLKFFERICKSHDLQAVVMAHHADDQAETVMLRLLTQASLEKLAGISEVSKIRGLTIWRPLLSTKKMDLENFLKKENSFYFEDKTNTDLTRKRSLFRHRLFPTIEEITDRDVVSSLVYLGEQLGEMTAFLEEMAAPFLSTVNREVWGWKWRVDPLLQTKKLLLRFVLRSVLLQAGFGYYRRIVEGITDALSLGLANRIFEASGRKIFVDRGVLLMPDDDRLLMGSSWSVTFTAKEPQEAVMCSNWEDLWQGKFFALLPTATAKIVAPDLQYCYPGSRSIRLWWNKNKVPACMRYAAPLVVDEQGRVIHEFLTGRVILDHRMAASWICLEGRQ